MLKLEVSRLKLKDFELQLKTAANIRLRDRRCQVKNILFYYQFDLRNNS